MTIKLQLKPEIEAWIIAQADAKGVSVEAYIESLIEEKLAIQEDTLSASSVTDEEWAATLKDLIDSPAFCLAPPLSDAAISREIDL